MWVSAPTGVILSFARPKESIQRKDRPVTACLRRYAILLRLQAGVNHPWFTRSLISEPLRFSLLPGVCRRAILALDRRDSSLNRPFGQLVPLPPNGAKPPKAAMLGAANGV
jgi:hypothetical protein